MLCTLCGKRESNPGRKRCPHCAAIVAAAQWRWKQGQPRKERQRVARVYNMTTDPLIVSHMPLAKKLARRIGTRLRLQDYSELVGDAMYGLVVAGRTFDESHGVVFATWAMRQIRSAVYDGIRRQSRQRRNQELAA